jgi:DNA-binding SARP family transcriptional activator
MLASAGLSALSETDMRDLLARLQSKVQGVQNLAATGLLAIAQQIAGQWYDEAPAVERAWHAYELAVEDEERTRRSLVVVLRTLIELVGLPVRDDDRESGRPQPAVEVQSRGVPVGASAATVRCVDPTVPVEARTAGLAACLLGPFCLLRNGHPLGEWHGNKTSRVLRFLVAQRGRSVPLDALIEVFWPDADAEAGRRSVHQMIYTIRKSLRGADSHDEDGSDPPLISFENDAYALNVQGGFWCDATVFEELVSAGRRAEAERRIDDAVLHYEEAQRLYRGDVLEDLPYDEWVLADRRHLRMLYVETVNRLAEARLNSGAVDEALELSHRLLNHDPCDESAHRRLMRCYARAGNRGLLVQQYEACADAMERLLGLAPDPETVELYTSLVNRQ